MCNNLLSALHLDHIVTFFGVEYVDLLVSASSIILEFYLAAHRRHLTELIGCLYEPPHRRTPHPHHHQHAARTQENRPPTQG
ncbi:hypothetical protein BU23DRAFT_150919 [Bimuria novae-zelandiae CBS 107.79]|uniref:Uncharacterized protein n=1 Tax=Bimuria novae-zelandiae CBS 107.79 TaxID=1447943 RepID=A0A6A5VPN5_9PLEO|nr:hypothetical protein BU23DRAFT_150919 [Bimuria novae-zelandiae CBS 107.79]